MSYHIVRQEKFTQEQAQIVDEAMSHHAFEMAGVKRDRGDFAVVIQGEEGEFLAGVQGHSYYGCLHIELLLVMEAARGKRAGSVLLDEVEKIAKEKRYGMLTLETMDFQAKPFYEKNGFEVEFVREGFAGDVKMYFMKKVL